MFNIRKEIQKDWNSTEPKLVEMTHELEYNGLIKNKDYVWQKDNNQNLSKHFDIQ